MTRLLGYQVRNVLRSRWLAAYALFFLLVTDALLRFGGDDGKVLLGLGNVTLLVVPLVGLVFGTTALYEARPFTELLLAQPVGRGQLFAALYGGLALPTAAAYVLGAGLPFALHGVPSGHGASLLVLLGAGALLTGVFVALAFLVALRTDDRARGLGAAVGLWLALALLYDGGVLLLLAVFGDHALERPLLAAMLANPVDLARVLLLLRFDGAALLGYTGAVFARFFGGPGALVAAALLLAWVAVPAAFGARAFRRKDF
ncbi:ABC transporter permease subunit [Roseisolibacter sp. H3M3-2]|uniref:ABC transporter permease subunit n=1 Tax=Roseisolibacter sp. H3M3-2 TaxID=3031323 RepID=UPI0023DB7A58|nr:ABC transporter permease subunit [Roseisolibacter sp. H3M3-2]MDF1504648.1 ABC transporter permease subunit [Roseisolibacter sp. H3M3-2]